MTVKELIEKLREFDGELEVFVENDGMSIDILNVDQDSISGQVYIEVYS